MRAGPPKPFPQCWLLLAFRTPHGARLALVSCNALHLSPPANLSCGDPPEVYGEEPESGCKFPFVCGTREGLSSPYSPCSAFSRVLQSFTGFLGAGQLPSISASRTCTAEIVIPSYTLKKQRMFFTDIR